MLTLEPERLKNQLATTRKRSPEMEGSSRETLKRLAISVCQCLVVLSFFHRVSVMAAILRASVRRAIVGLIPLASDRW